MIEFTIHLKNQKELDLGLETEDVEAKMYVRPDNIIAFRQSFDAQLEEDGAMIYLSSGENFYVTALAEEIKTLLK